MSARLDTAVVLLRKLVGMTESSAGNQILPVFAAFRPDEVIRLIEEYPDVLLLALGRASVKKDQALDDAVLGAMRSVPPERLSGDELINVITLRAMQNEIAKQIVVSLGVQKLVRHAISTIANPERASIGAKALEAIRNLGFPGTDTELNAVVPELTALMTSDSQSVVWNAYFAAADVLSHLITRKVQVPHLDAALAAIPQALRVCFQGVIFTHHPKIREPYFSLVKNIFARIEELRAASGEGEPMPAAKDIAKGLFRCQWQDVHKYVVVESTALLGKLETSVVVDAALEFFPVDANGEKPNHHDSMPEIQFLALHTAARLAAGPPEGPVHLGAKKILDRLANFLPAEQDADTSQWTHGIYAALGTAVLPELWRLGFVDRRLSDFYAKEMICGVVNKCPVDAFPFYHRDILDALASDVYRVHFDVAYLLRALALPLYATLSPHLLAMVEERSVSASAQVRALSLLSAQHWNFGLELPCSDGRLDTALRYCADPRPAYRHAAICVLVKALESMHKKDWRGYGPHVDHPRGAEIAPKAAAGIADADAKFGDGIESAFRNSTNDLRVYCVLGLLEAAVQHPDNPLMLRAIRWTAELGCGYWGTPVLGVNTERADFVCRALESANAELRNSAAQLFYQIVQKADAPTGDRLTVWIANAIDQANASSEVIDAGLCLADNLPKRASQYDALVTNVITAPERLLKSSDQVNVLRKLADGNSVLLRSLLDRVAAVRNDSPVELLTQLSHGGEVTGAAIGEALALVMG